MKTILSLFDYSGAWSQPYLDAGHRVIRVDVKDAPYVDNALLTRITFDLSKSARAFLRRLHFFMDVRAHFSYDIRDKQAWGSHKIDGILAAPPCTDFAGSGARWWKEKDANGTTAKSVNLMRNTLKIIQALQPDWWALENPVGRVNTLLPDMKVFGPWYFQPWEYGDPYTKKTGLWGRFNRNLVKTPVEPTEGSMMWAKYGGKSERTKTARSVTPAGFAKAFYEANKWES